MLKTGRQLMNAPFFYAELGLTRINTGFILLIYGNVLYSM